MALDKVYAGFRILNGFLGTSPKKVRLRGSPTDGCGFSGGP